MRLEVEKLVYGGDGLSRAEGEVILTPFVLPGEAVDAAKEPKRSGITRARLEAVITPSPQRVSPPCPYFTRCGGCHYQHAAYEAQLAAKRAILAETFQRVGKIALPDDVPIISAEPYGYRNRIQLHFEDGMVGYREARSKTLIAIEECPISSPKLNACIAALNRMSKDRRWPSFLGTAELFTNESDVQFHVLESERPLAQRFFDWCAEEIPGMVTGSLEYDGYRVSYGSFFQVNRFLAQPLRDAAIAGAEGDFAVDLYAGVGLFTVPLASKFRTVTAVESGSGAVRDLMENAARKNVDIEARAENVDVFLETLTKTPDFVLADPTRTGLGKAVVRRLLELKPPQLVIVACDPATLARDTQMLLAGGYRMERVTMVDLFPQTYHIETIVHLNLMP